MFTTCCNYKAYGRGQGTIFLDETRLFSEKLIRSQCVVVVVKRLNVLTTCREKLISDCTEAGTYSPPSLNVVLMRPHTGARRLTTWRRTVAWILVVEGGGPVPCSGN